MDCPTHLTGSGVAVAALFFMLPSISAHALEEAPAGATDVVASEKSFYRESLSPSTLDQTFDRAEDMLADGRIREAADMFAVVAKLADEPLKSRAEMKYGYAAAMLARPDAAPALTAAAQTPVDDPEGSEIRSFAGRMMDQISGPGSKTLLTAPPKTSSRLLARRASIAAPPFWDQIRDIETLHRKGRLTTAVRQYRDLLAAYPDHPVLLNNLALILADGIDAVEAESLVHRALTAPGGDQYVEYLYDTLGLALLEQGRAADSIENFRRSLSMRETADRNGHMAMALDRIGQPDAAEQYRERAGALDVTGTWSTE